jgi:hypothetical protein
VSHDVVVEGYQLRPALMSEILGLYPGRVRAILLVKRDELSIAEGFRANRVPSDWATQRTRDDENFARIARMLVMSGRRVRTEAMGHGMDVCSMGGDSRANSPMRRRSCFGPPARSHACRPRSAKTGRRFHGHDPAPQRHQQVELSEAPATVTAWRLHTLTCAGCGAMTRAALPAEAMVAFGPRLHAAVALLLGRFRLSHRQVPELLGELFGVALSEGAVTDCAQRVSEALAVPVQQAAKAAQAQPVAHLAETGSPPSPAIRWGLRTLGGGGRSHARSRGGKTQRLALAVTPDGGMGKPRPHAAAPTRCQGSYQLGRSPPGLRHVRAGRASINARLPRSYSPMERLMERQAWPDGF